MHGSRHRSVTSTTPVWATACDAMTLSLVAVAIGVAWLGGFRVVWAGVRIAVTSPARVMIWAVGVSLVRHVLFREAPLWRRAQSMLAPKTLLGMIESAWRWVIARPWGRLIPQAGLVAAVVLFLVSFGRYYRPDTGLTNLIAFGGQFEEQALPAVRNVTHAVQEHATGYDGQFYAQLAVDPLLRDPAIVRALDDPFYRARRIFFSWTAYVLGLGQPYWILQAYAAQNILWWLVLAWVLLRWFPLGEPRALFGWFACLFSYGSIFSVRAALPDGPSNLLVALAVVAIECRRDRFAVVVLGLAGLARETTLLSGAMLASSKTYRPTGLLRLAGSVCLIALPLFAWVGYLRALLGSAVASFSGVSNFAPPLVAYLAKWQASVSELHQLGWWSFAHFSVYALVSLTVQALYLVWRLEWKDAWWRVGIPYVGLMVVLGPAVWGGYPGAVTRVLLPMTIAFNVLLVGDAWFWPLVLLGNLTVLHGLSVLEPPFLSSYL